MRSLQRRETTSSIVEIRKQLSVQTSSNNFLNPKLSFPPRTRNLPTEVTLFRLTPIRWPRPVILIRHLVAKRRNQLSVWKPRSSVYCFFQHQLSPFKLFSGCESIRFWSEKSFCFSTKRLRFVAFWVSFTLRWNDRVKIKLRSDAFLKFFFKIRLFWAKTSVVVIPSYENIVKEAIKARVIDVKITWVSNYRCPIWKISNRTPVIGHPRDHAPIFDFTRRGNVILEKKPKAPISAQKRKNSCTQELPHNRRAKQNQNMLITRAKKSFMHRSRMKVLKNAHAYTKFVEARWPHG